MNANLIIVGAFAEIIELAEENGLNILGLIDNTRKTNYLGYPILGTDETAANLFVQHKNNPVLICPDLPRIRVKLYQLYQQIGFQFTGIISKNSKLSKSSQVGEGTVVQSLVNISSECKIGCFVKLNILCNIMHNCVVGNFTTIAPNSVILGNVSIGSRCYIGSNATILPNIIISNDVTIGAGAVVTKDVPEGVIAKGNPARF